MVSTKKNESWILEGRSGWVADLLRSCLSTPENILHEFSTEDQRKADGFACKLVITGEGGGIFELMFSEKKGISPKFVGVPLRNIVIFGEETLEDMTYPDLSQITAKDGEISGVEALVYLLDSEGIEAVMPKLRPRMTLSKALSNQEIIFDGENPDIDGIKWRQIFDKILYKVAFPVMVRAIWSGNKKK
ncbi:MAG: hypothetical protein PHN57_07860 [Candidatus Omnitrophica bacterium]|nr:hypothetical protein [Candidatus Omnitrophota bacterium]